MSGLNKIYFFDIDDTLFRTTDFNAAAVENCLKICDKYDVDISHKQAIELFYQLYPKIKSSNNMILDFFIELYQHSPAKFVDESEAVRIGGIASKLYDDYFKIYFRKFIAIGAKELIEYLVLNGFFVGIISQGNPILQKKKFEMLGLDKFFDKRFVFLLEKKTVDSYLQIRNFLVSNFNFDEFYMIGDREDVDVILPQKLGFTPIRVYGHTKYQDRKYSNYLNYGYFKDVLREIKKGNI